MPKKNPKTSNRPPDSKLGGLVLEASFEEISPTTREEVSGLMTELETGTKTLAETLKSASPSARRQIETLLRDYEVPADLMRRARGAVIFRSLVDAESRAEALAAAKVAQTEETITTMKDSSGLSEDLMADAKIVMDKKRKQLEERRAAFEKSRMEAEGETN